MNHAAQMAALMNRLDFVVWDRMVETRYWTKVYGWIAGRRGRDFVLLEFTTGEDDDLAVQATTSSPAFAPQIDARLHPLKPIRYASESIADAFGDLVYRTTDGHRAAPLEIVA